jgi:DNA-binding GntR family transcriptional regulator
VAEGLLRREAHKPAYVPVLSEADLFLMRTPLELEVVRVLAGRRSAPAQAGKAVDDLAAIGPERPHSEFVEAGLGFHRALVAAVDSPRLGRVYQALSGEIHLSMSNHGTRGDASGSWPSTAACSARSRRATPTAPPRSCAATWTGACAKLAQGA